MIPAFETTERGAGDQGYPWLLSLRRNLDYRKGSEEKKKRKQEKKGSVWVSGETLRLSIIDSVIWAFQESPGLVLQGCLFLRHPGHRLDSQREGLGYRTEHCPGCQDDLPATFISKVCFPGFQNRDT